MVALKFELAFDLILILLPLPSFAVEVAPRISDHFHSLELSIDPKKFVQKDGGYEIFPEYYLIKVNKFDNIARDTLDE